MKRPKLDYTARYQAISPRSQLKAKQLLDEERAEDLRSGVLYITFKKLSNGKIRMEPLPNQATKPHKPFNKPNINWTELDQNFREILKKSPFS